MLARLILLGFIFLTPTIFNAPNLEAATDPAFESYHQGIDAKTIGEREQAIEKALALYLERFNVMKQEGKANGWLCYNIANCYFNLKQLGYAIYYYRLGLQLLPGNEKIEGNLQIALDQREDGVDIKSDSIMETLLFFHYKIPTAKKIIILILASIITALFLAGLIIKPSNLVRYGVGISCPALLAMLVSIFTQYYYPNHIGVIIRSTDIRQDAGRGFAPILAAPIQEGSSLRVISLKEKSLEDNWFRVKLNDSRRGYVAAENLKLVN